MWKIKAYTPVPEGERTCEKRMKARTRWGAVLKILYAKILYDYVEVEEVRKRLTALIFGIDGFER